MNFRFLCCVFWIRIGGKLVNERQDCLMIHSVVAFYISGSLPSKRKQCARRRIWGERGWQWKAEATGRSSAQRERNPNVHICPSHNPTEHISLSQVNSFLKVFHAPAIIGTHGGAAGKLKPQWFGISLNCRHSYGGSIYDRVLQLFQFGGSGIFFKSWLQCLFHQNLCRSPCFIKIQRYLECSRSGCFWQKVGKMRKLRKR